MGKGGRGEGGREEGGMGLGDRWEWSSPPVPVGEDIEYRGGLIYRGPD